MMKKLSYGATLATMAATFLIVSGAEASIAQEPSGTPASSKTSKSKMTRHQEGTMEKSGMRQEPHHMLARAYEENLVNFAKALRHHAADAATVNPEFARAAVAEMKRSFDQMQQHHLDHMKTLDEKMKAEQADMMKQMDIHQKAIQEFLAALDKEVQTSTPDPKSITKYVSEILKHCESMGKMHGEPREHKMEPKTN